MQSPQAPDLSVVVPLCNESAGIESFYLETVAFITRLTAQYEFIFVDDGSTDQTWSQIEALRSRDPRIKAVRFSRNFGHQAALMAGLERSTGRRVLMMDGDLQHPPSLIPELWLQADQGFEVVQAIRRGSEGGWFKRMTSKWFYKFFNAISEVKMEPNAADFRLVSKRVCATVIGLEERDLFLRGIFSWMGFRSVCVSYDPGQRRHGTTKYGLRRMARFFVSGITSFSAAPLRLSILLCSGALILAVAYSGYAVWMKVVARTAIPGWTSLLILLCCFFSGVFFMLGIIGEYLSKIYLEIKKRPRYLVDQVLE